jgi:hypothetical protein
MRGSNANHSGVTRRQFLVWSGAAAVSGLLASRASARTLGRARRSVPRAAGAPFVSRPDLVPPSVTITTPAKQTASGYILLAPFDITGKAPKTRQYGPLIVDNAGQPVWFRPISGTTAMGLRVQKYKGKPVLTWYEGQVLGPYGGEFVVVDTGYRELMRVKAARGYKADLHEFLLTSRGTALISIYSEIRTDLSSVGGPADGRLVEGVVQELELPSGRVLFEWRSSTHVPVDESFLTDVTPAGNVDYFHLNSIAVDLDGNLLVSARNTSAVYKVERKTGRILWRLGGKKSDFAVDPAAAFSFQHDVRRHADGTLTIFDNAASAPPTGSTGEASSRPIRVSLDMNAMTASLVDVLEPPSPRLAFAMGDLQQLPDGGAFVGWGTAGPFTEFTSSGEIRFDAGFADGSVTYRAYRFPWAGRPSGRPAVAVRPASGGKMTVHASWNGATEVTHWQVRGGPAAGRLKLLGTARRRGFETVIPIRRRNGYVSVAAVDASGRVLGTSAAVRA